MPTRSLTTDPSLEHLKKKAKRLQKAVRAGDAAALAQVAEHHPRATRSAGPFSLADAQLVTARTYGFASWTRLKQYVSTVAPFVWSPPARNARGSLLDAFLGLACLDYGDWHRSNPDKARRLLEDHPELAHADVYSAAAVGNVEGVREMIDRDPALVDGRGGALRWEPLLYACYSRMQVPPYSTLEVARLLLARGADPNAGVLWGGKYVFTALTGAFGEGEDGDNNPPHPHRDELATLLLDAGADPNDGQTLYNRHFRDSDDHLTLLFWYGLGQDKRGPWFRRLGERATSPSRMLVEELWSAAKNNRPARVALLIEHGVDVNTPGLRDGRTPYEAAMREGHVAIADYLRAHGATASRARSPGTVRPRLQCRQSPGSDGAPRGGSRAHGKARARRPGRTAPSRRRGAADGGDSSQRGARRRHQRARAEHRHGSRDSAQRRHVRLGRDGGAADRARRRSAAARFDLRFDADRLGGPRRSTGRGELSRAVRVDLRRPAL